MASLTKQDVRDELASAFPPGLEAVVNVDGGIFGGLIDHDAEVIADTVITSVDQLSLDSCPLTCGADRLVEWESNLSLSATKTALTGTQDQRRNQVISRLRLRGAMTLAKIRAVVAPCLDMAAADVEVIEPDAAEQRSLHTYQQGSLGGGSFTVVVIQTVDFWVNDDGPVSPAGAQVDVQVTCADLSKLIGRLYAPDGTYVTLPSGRFGRGAAVAQTVRLHFPTIRAPRVMGKWSLSVWSEVGTGSVDDAWLFVEGTGRSSSLAKFEYGVVVDSALVGPAVDVTAAQDAMLSIRYATRIDGVIYQSSLLGPTDHGAIPEDNAIPDACIPVA
mgnify:FL=1